MCVKFIRRFDEYGKIQIPKAIRDSIFHGDGDNCDQKQMSISIVDDAIILKEHVVIDDNHCVWKYNDLLRLAESTCGEYLDMHRIDINKLKYCPYCGKQIKLTYK